MRIDHGDRHYPSRLIEILGPRAPTSLAALGNLDHLCTRKLALFCSVKCPGSIVLRAHDLAHSLRNAGVTVIGGFHSPMEKECLNVLLRGTQPLIVCPARSIEGMRLPADWKAPLAAGRLLLLSPFAERQRRATAEQAHTRNELVAALADAILVAHAAPGGGTERFCRALKASSRQVLTLDAPANAELVATGATPVRPYGVASWWLQEQA